jgi:hypothetical protein
MAATGFFLIEKGGGEKGLCVGTQKVLLLLSTMGNSIPSGVICGQTFDDVYASSIVRADEFSPACLSYSN